MNDTREQLEAWIKAWEEMAEEIKSESKSPQPKTSFFNNQPSTQDYSNELASDNDMELWSEMYHGVARLDPKYNETDGDDERDGFDHLVRGDKQLTKGDVSYYSNPQNKFAIGPDAAKEYGPVRVTKNWSQGEELEELSQIKQNLEYLERVFLRAEARKESTEKISKELESLRKRASDLSEKIQSQVSKDIT